MKSEFLKQLSLLLIPNKETDYIDVYKLQNIKNWPLFTIAHYNSDNELGITPEKVTDTSKYAMDEIDFLGLEYSEIIDFNETELTIDAGGEFQGLHRIIIGLDNENKLYVKSCEIIPELSDNFIEISERHSEEEYEIFLEKLQIILEENQD